MLNVFIFFEFQARKLGHTILQKIGLDKKRLVNEISYKVDDP